MKIALLLLVLVLLAFIQYDLWFNPNGLVKTIYLKRVIALKRADNDKLKKRNERLIKRIDVLKHDKESIESLAREQNGMIKSDEVFYQFVDQPKN